MFLDEIGSYLQSKGIGTLGVDVFTGLMPDTPDNCLAIFEYAGSPPDLHWDGRHPGLQVRARNKSYPTGRQKIESVIVDLHGVSETVIGTTRYLLIRANQEPESLGRDANGRNEWVVNFSVIKEG